MKHRILILILAVLALCGCTPLMAQVTRYNSTGVGYASSLIATKGTNTVLTVTGYNSKASAQFIQLFDSATLPADGGAEVSTCNLGTRTPAQLANGYFTISSPTVDYYVWFNLDSGGVDPAPAGKTGIAVAISTGNTDAQMATAAAAAIDALAAFVTTASSTTITNTNAVGGAATDIGVGTLTTGVTVAVTAQGIAPIAVITAAASSNFQIPLPPYGIPLTSGCVVCNSSTGPTKTIGSADVFITVTWQ